jgi:hypothetical protein
MSIIILKSKVPDDGYLKCIVPPENGGRAHCRNTYQVCEAFPFIDTKQATNFLNQYGLSINDWKPLNRKTMIQATELGSGLKVGMNE